MKTRAMNENDVMFLRDIHRRYYANEFSFPNFLKNWVGCFVITDDEDRILIGGGVKPLAESVIITNKDMNVRLLGRALIETAKVSEYLCENAKIEQLHAFVQDAQYKSHLLRHGFEPTKGDSLVLSF